jgi:hypothetical protein
MSTDFSEIMAAMSSVPDIVIDPHSGATVGGTGKTLGEAYDMEGKVSPQMAEKIRERAKLNLEGKESSKNMVDAYKEMMGVPTSIDLKNDQILENYFNEMANGTAVQPIHEVRQGVETLAEDIEDPMMDMYVNSINNKNKWSK